MGARPRSRAGSAGAGAGRAPRRHLAGRGRPGGRSGARHGRFAPGWPRGSGGVYALIGYVPREAPVTTGPEDHRRAAAARRGQLRAAQADREAAIDALKAAYVAGRLSEDELEARVGQALGSRTHADLAAITADIPAGPVAVRAARMPDRMVAWGTGAIIAAAALGGALLVGGSALILWAITMTGVLLFTVSVLLNERQERRSRTRRPSRSAPGGPALEGGRTRRTGHEPPRPEPTSARSAYAGQPGRRLPGRREAAGGRRQRGGLRGYARALRLPELAVADRGRQRGASPEYLSSPCCCLSLPSPFSCCHSRWRLCCEGTARPEPARPEITSVVAWAGHHGTL
jgi:hypothetical protein